MMSQVMWDNCIPHLEKEICKVPSQNKEKRAIVCLK